MVFFFLIFLTQYMVHCICTVNFIETLSHTNSQITKLICCIYETLLRSGYDNAIILNFFKSVVESFFLECKNFFLPFIDKHDKRLPLQEAVQHILDLPSGSEMSDLNDEFSEDERDLDIANTNVMNIENDEEKDIDNNNDDENPEVQNNESNESQEHDDGGEEQNNSDEGELGDKEDDEQK